MSKDNKRGNKKEGENMKVIKMKDYLNYKQKSNKKRTKEDRMRAKSRLLSDDDIYDYHQNEKDSLKEM